MKFRCLLLACLASTIAYGGNRPNILFLLADDMRPDAISALGNERIETPNLDRLVSRGTTFLKATCSYPICVVSRAEILTGRHGWENGVNGITNQLKADQTYWGDALKAAGYETWYVGKWHTSGRPLARGYDQVAGLFSGGGAKWWKEGQTDWKDFPITGYRGWVFQNADRSEMFPKRGIGLTPDIDSKFANAAIDLLSQNPTKPWFLHVNFTGPHDPLFIPPGLEGKYQAEEMELPGNFVPEHPFDHGNLRQRDESLMNFPRTKAEVRDVLRVYYSVIDYIDQQVGRILTTLEQTGQLENTIVIFASDHGMGVGSHGLRGKQNMYEHTMNVPLIVAGPGIKKNHQTQAEVYLRDIFPTTCELAHAPIPKSVTAKSFAPVVTGETETHRKAIFGYFRDKQRMIRKNGWKYIVYPEARVTQLFDLVNDPLERANLAGEKTHAIREQQLAKELEQWRRKMGDPLAP